jgi:hypothetical protein
MKMSKFSPARFFAVAAIALSASFTLTSCSDDDDDIDDSNYTISGNASGSQMIPSTQGSGTAAISGNYNANSNTLSYSTSWNGLTSAPTLGGFYTGAVGQTGASVGTAWNFGTNPGVTGNLSGTLMLTDAQETSLLNGNMYYILGTTTHTSGEVRGQILASKQ